MIILGPFILIKFVQKSFQHGFIVIDGYIMLFEIEILPEKVLEG